LEGLEVGLSETGALLGEVVGLSDTGDLTGALVGTGCGAPVGCFEGYGALRS